MALVKTYISASLNRKTGMSPIYVSFYLGSEKVVLPTKVSTKREWFHDGVISKKDKESADKNLIIDQTISHVNNILVKYRLKEKTLTKNIFMSQWSRPQGYDTFYDFADWYLFNHSKELELGTIKNHKTALCKLRSYAPDLTLDNLSEQFFLDYRAHCLKDLGNKKTTVNKNLGAIKKYVLAAYKMRLIEENPFASIKITRNYDTEAEYLTEEELHVLCNLYQRHNLSAPLQRSLLFFLFMCFGSMHVSDARSFRIEQITEKYITYIRKKTKNSKGILLHIPISKSLRAIINEAKGQRAAGTLFQDLPADQKININLRSLMHKAGIEKHVSCKTGRHTFATLFLKNTRDINTLKKLMGHSDLQETLRYAHVLDEDKLTGVKCFDGYL